MTHVKDRTAEFHACADLLGQRNGPSARLLAQQAQPLGATGAPKSEFTKAAAQIAREINATTAKLHSLTRLARKKTLFDDRPNEINDLVLGIKQDITKLNRQIALLQQHQRSQVQQQQQQRQLQEHSSNVITSLQTRLATASSDFKAILESRTNNLREQKSRREQYSYSPQPQHSQQQQQQQQQQPLTASFSSSASPFVPPVPAFAGDSPSSLLFVPTVAPNHSSPLYNPDSRKTNAFLTDDTNADGLRNRSSTVPGSSNGDSVIDMGFGSAGGQQLLVQQQYSNAASMEYIESRGQAIETIESTIAELGQIYSQFTQILSQQREMVQTIDDNVMDTEVNVINAHNELAKFLERLQGNRWLMIQVFAILVVFFMLFVVIA
ncbi:cis-Golgi t-SNARE syntaxin [Entophlyctis luteolus]|nr:cis-Golgi t-SNARE syntaxin [Entophlyctis luteolus]